MVELVHFLRRFRLRALAIGNGAKIGLITSGIAKGALVSISDPIRATNWPVDPIAEAVSAIVGFWLVQRRQHV